MKRSRLLLLVIFAVVAAIIVWRVSFYKPKAERAEKPPERKEVTEPNKPAEPNEPGEPNKPAEPNKPSEPNKPVEPNEPNEPNEPSDPMENINFKELEMKHVIQKLAEWTGKVIVPHEEVMGKKISIYSEKKRPRNTGGGL